MFFKNMLIHSQIIESHNKALRDCFSLKPKDILAVFGDISDESDRVCAERFFEMMVKSSATVESGVNDNYHILDYMMDTFLNRGLIDKEEHEEYSNQRKDMQR
jgi:hypothetical protein